MPKKTAAKPQPTWQPSMGDKVSMGTETVYEIVKVNSEGTEVDLQLPHTNIMRFRVPVADLTPVMVS